VSGLATCGSTNQAIARIIQNNQEWFSASLCDNIHVLQKNYINKSRRTAPSGTNRESFWTSLSSPNATLTSALYHNIFIKHKESIPL
jgi:hypothetical protein